MLKQKVSNDLVVNSEHNTSMLTQKGSNDFAVNSEHDTSMLTQKGSNDLDHSEPKRPHIELMQEKALKNNSSFVVWSSTPFDSQPEESRTQTRLLAISARPSCQSQPLELQ
ncbi:hypothetical protein DPMN_037287 [Dreissena polymorpha]|uniref:Uncharacterized protein n=1 Tax=Dreissena polymorpha TaxID=45954 RepID=A0A9D4MF30_DREPO|nr:hypothetical protein DPMN_037287 [Dreissena polymorpha]